VAPEGKGLVHTDGNVSGRRIFVDDRSVGQTPATVTVKCGAHRIRIGSAGRTQRIDVPCRGEVRVVDR
jgi:serine/threonine-protein kinase